MDKDGFKQQVRMNLEKALKQQHLSQTQILKKCRALGYQLTQPEVSRLLSGKTPVTLYQITAFAKALEIPVEQLISGKRQTERIFNIPAGSFITDPDDDAFNGYLGSYYTLFRSTSAFEDNWLTGKLTFAASGEENAFCRAVFELDTGETNKKGQPVIKSYDGELIVSSRLGVAYCILMNETMGELSVIEFRHRNFFVKQVECRMGLVLTTSAGESRVPVTQKLFMTRTPISDELAVEIQPFLKLAHDELVIDERYLAELREMYPEIDLSPLREGKHVFRNCLLNEKTLRGREVSVSRERRTSLIRALRERAEAEYLYNITEREDGLVYEAEKKFSD